MDGVSGGSDESRECMPCGGSGRVISNLGGSPEDVPCPWCSGTGRRQANVDAQASWRERLEGESAGGEAPAEAAPTGGATGGAPGPVGPDRDSPGAGSAPDDAGS